MSHGVQSLPGASRRTAPPAVEPLRSGAPAPNPLALLTSLLEDVVEDPAAAAKDRHRRLVNLLWWVHRWQAYRVREAQDVIGIGLTFTLADVAANAGLSRAQADALRDLPPTEDDELTTLRLVSRIVDM